MRSQQSRFPALAASVFAITLLSTTPHAVAAVKAGASCPAVGKIEKVGKTSLVCAKVGKKLTWSKSSIKMSSTDTATTPITPVVIEKPKLTKLQSEGCHAQVSAIVQKKVGDTWVDVAPADGWERVATCDADHPYQPYARVEIVDGTSVRWKVYSPGAWEWFSSTLVMKTLIAPSVGAKVPAITAAKYVDVAKIARASVTADMPTSDKSVGTTYIFENTIFDNIRADIKAGASAALSHYAPFLSTKTDIRIFVFGTSAFIKNEAPKLDPINQAFLADMENMSTKWGGRDPQTCVGMGGFAVSETPFPLIAIDAPCKINYPADLGVLPHELTHTLQITFSGANPRCWAPTWFVEGQAQVGASSFAYGGTGSASDGHHQSWVNRIVRPTSVTAIRVMENETSDYSEYTLGAALSDYLVAKGGWLRSMKLYKQAAAQVNASCLSGVAKMDNFNLAFLSLYGQSLEDFYAEALPYLQWQADHK